MTEALLRPLIWMDYRLALLLTVIIPLALLVWSFVQRFEPISTLLGIYWKVASLLAITVYLMIAAFPISFIAAILARVLIPISLWFWVDINDDIADMQPWRPLRVAFNSWRWAITMYCSIGALFSLAFVPCAFSSKAALLQKATCRVWLDAPWGFREVFHQGSTPGFLGFLGIAGLVFYLACLAYFLFVKLGRTGRSAATY